MPNETDDQGNITNWAPAKVTAKVKVSARTDNVWNEGTPSEVAVAQLTFTVDYNDGRNKEWAAATPALSLSMSVRKEIADAHFPLGRAITLTFEPTQD